MAQRDRSQGFAFVYVDIRKLLAEKDTLIQDDFGSQQPIPTQGAPVINFNKPTMAPAPAVKAQPANPAVEQVRQNLDRLQSLHHKLHAMLEELNQLTDEKKNKK